MQLEVPLTIPDTHTTIRYKACNKTMATQVSFNSIPFHDCMSTAYYTGVIPCIQYTNRSCTATHTHQVSKVKFVM